MPIETLTYSLIKKRLQIANCCAAKQGNDIILKQNKGIGCRSEQKKVQKIVDYVDAIREFGCIVEQKKACHLFDLTGHAPFNNIEIKASNPSIDVGFSWQGTLAKTITALAAQFGFGGYTISSDSNSLLLCVPISQGASGNSDIWTMIITTGITDVTTTGTFACGITGNHTSAQYSSVLYYVDWAIVGATPFNLTLTLNFEIGGISVFTSSAASTIPNAINDIVAQINTAYGSEIATYNDTQRQFHLNSPDSGAVGNTYTITWTTNVVGSPNISPVSKSLIGGVDEVSSIFDDTNTCLKTNEIESILNALCELCSAPCDTYVNF